MNMPNSIGKNNKAIGPRQSDIDMLGMCSGSFLPLRTFILISVSQSAAVSVISSLMETMLAIVQLNKLGSWFCAQVPDTSFITSALCDEGTQIPTLSLGSFMCFVCRASISEKLNFVHWLLDRYCTHPESSGTNALVTRSEIQQVGEAAHKGK